MCDMRFGRTKTCSMIRMLARFACKRTNAIHEIDGQDGCRSPITDVEAHGTSAQGVIRWCAPALRNFVETWPHNKRRAAQTGTSQSSACALNDAPIPMKSTTTQHLASHATRPCSRILACPQTLAHSKNLRRQYNNYPNTSFQLFLMCKCYNAALALYQDDSSQTNSRCPEKRRAWECFVLLPLLSDLEVAKSAPTFDQLEMRALNRRSLADTYQKRYYMTL